MIAIVTLVVHFWNIAARLLKNKRKSDLSACAVRTYDYREEDIGRKHENKSVRGSGRL